MKKFLIHSLSLLVASTLFLSSCKDGKDGEPGPGFTEALKYGNIVVTLDGKRPDDIAFTKTLNFRFTPIGGTEFNDASLVTRGDNNNSFELMRFWGTVDDVYQENYVNFDFNVDSSNGTNSFTTNYFQLVTFIEDGNKFFEINYNNYTDFITDDSFKSYSFDSATGALTFTVEFTVPGASNSTLNNLNVKVVGKLTVLEQI